MRKSIALLGLLALLTMLTCPTYAQGRDDTASECDFGSVVIRHVETIRISENWGQLLEALKEFQVEIAVCNGGYTWSGYGDSMLGPIDLEAGTYVLEYVSSVDRGEVFNYFGVHLVGLTDARESDKYIINDDVPGEQDRRGEVIEVKGGTSLRLKGGMYLFEVSLLSYLDWTFRLYRVN